MIDNIERDFLKELGINLVIHLDPIVTDDSETNEVKELVLNIVKSINEDISIHDFRMVKCKTNINLIFDVLTPVNHKQKDSELIKSINTEIKNHNPNYNVVITVDKNYV